MLPQKALKQICLQDQKDAFLMSEYEPESKLSLKILNLKDNKAYTGEASSVELRAQAAKIRLTFSDFVSKVTSALFLKTSEGLSFLYSLDQKHEKYSFNWKSRDEEETIINLGCIEMVKRDSALVYGQVLQCLSEEMYMQKSKVQSLSEELSDSKNQLSATLKQLSFANDLKSSLEKEMYSKFVLVLNEKKRKIRELQKDVNSNIISNPPKKFKSLQILPDSDSSNEAICSDQTKPGPSKAVPRNSLLFLDEDKPTVSTTRNRVRNRKVPVTKKLQDKFDLGISCQNKTISKIEDDKSDDSDDLLKCL